ncbi:hypothetical protein FRB94_014512 [Tulasnella sp. JGI-2019a]|nr:hypothetical protein FRB94_014512 [Tulasnella sp. JGI-2019a]
MSSTPTTQPTELPVAGPSRMIIPPIPPYNPKSPKRSSRSPSQSAIRPGANERVASSAQANNVDLEMNSLPRTNPPMPPTSSAPPAYDELVDRLEDLISPPEPTRARPLGGRRSDRNPSNPGHTTSASSGGTLVASSTQGTAYVPPPPAFGVKQSPDTVSRSFFYYGCELHVDARSHTVHHTDHDYFPSLLPSLLVHGFPRPCPQTPSNTRRDLWQAAIRAGGPAATAQGNRGEMGISLSRSGDRLLSGLGDHGHRRLGHSEPLMEVKHDGRQSHP